MSGISERSHQSLVLIATSSLSMVLGSVHAFSVFLEPLENSLALSRSDASLTYSLALLSLTGAVLGGPKIFQTVGPVPLVLAVGGVGGAGTLLAATAPDIVQIWLGYGLLFGAANGLGYGYGLQLAARTNPGREGWSMGCVTAFYAVGAAVAPFPLDRVIGLHGFAGGMIALAIVQVIASIGAAALLTSAHARFDRIEETGGRGRIITGDLIRLWLGYGTGVAAGLMAIGHATGIARAAGMTSDIWIAPTVVAVCNMAGSFVGGFAVDRFESGRLLTLVPLGSAIALGMLAMFQESAVMLLLLGAIGTAYGAMIAIYPAAISKRFGAADSPRIYGQVFTSWGLAGLVAPWMAGFLYDTSGSYQRALMAAACLALISAVGAFLNFAKRR